jgi:hypothetical protein
LLPVVESFLILLAASFHSDHREVRTETNKGQHKQSISAGAERLRKPPGYSYSDLRSKTLAATQGIELLLGRLRSFNQRREKYLHRFIQHRFTDSTIQFITITDATIQFITLHHKIPPGSNRDQTHLTYQVVERSWM